MNYHYLIRDVSPTSRQRAPRSIDSPVPISKGDTVSLTYRIDAIPGFSMENRECEVLEVRHEKSLVRKGIWPISILISAYQPVLNVRPKK